MPSLQMRLTFALISFAESVVCLAPSGPWDAFNYAPNSRVVYPASIHSTVGAVTGADALLDNTGSATLSGNGSWLTLDFGKEVGGLISLNFDAVSSTSSLALSFTESPMFIRSFASDDSSFPDASTTYDAVFPIPAPLSTGLWTQPEFSLRGGFRYLSIVLTGAQLAISNVSCAISFMPHVDNLRAYAGYFYAKDPFYHDPDFLTKVWMAGAYTVQTNTVPLDTGRMVPFESAGHWANNATLGVAGPIIVDGAKRDRAVWPGDMGIAVPTQFVSTNDLIPTRNAISTMFAHINPKTGALPESGPPLSQLNSDTYHCWTLIGTHNYYLYSGDRVWLQTIWTNYTKAVAFLEAKVNSTNGLMNVTGLRDWARQGGGGFNAEGNAILYRVLLTSAELGEAMALPDLRDAWLANATALKTAYNRAFWVPSLGMYRDNMTTTLTPQDANSLAILFNLTQTKEQAALISTGLEKNWNELGPVAPKLPDTISPFISSFELQAHFVAGNATRAMDLLHREWGYMLSTNLSVQSTLLEGFTANGSLGYRANVGYNHDAAYTSHAHGWSTGPTSALTIYVLGLSVTGVQGSTWQIAPQTAGLPGAEGGFETSLGRFDAAWTTTETTFALTVNTPTATEGLFLLPVEFEGSSVKVDGKKVALDGRSLVLSGGEHGIVATVRR
ncbi:Six-hairpin glycosidase [Mycena indigotica]|uniref:Six-hairpin glycosidase n=1 Tax=Mycena indigotica TaxID=2126181 RepID=A0A8H6TDW6_9AGAR|nr:Six-hairpin glycosidase [Mycena indigotica]KAF7314962.1 Six-hairpin glycosidase [Mycena indigotica]